MNNPWYRQLALWSLVVALGCAAVPAGAHTAAREGNTWDWRKHEPDPARVRREERRDGLITPQQAPRQNRKVEGLANKLLGEERAPRGGRPD